MSRSGSIEHTKRALDSESLRKDFIQEFHQKEKKEKDQDQGSFCSQTLSQYQPLV